MVSVVFKHVWKSNTSDTLLVGQNQWSQSFQLCSHSV